MIEGATACMLYPRQSVEAPSVSCTFDIHVSTEAEDVVSKGLRDDNLEMRQNLAPSRATHPPPP